jgi:hypothetical protein
MNQKRMMQTKAQKLKMEMMTMMITAKRTRQTKKMMMMTAKKLNKMQLMTTNLKKPTMHL